MKPYYHEVRDMINAYIKTPNPDSVSANESLGFRAWEILELTVLARRLYEIEAKQTAKATKESKSER